MSNTVTFLDLPVAGLPLFGDEIAVLVQFGVTVQCPINQMTILASYAKASQPSASVAGSLIYVTDDVDGAVPAFADGTHWRRVTDRNVIS